MLKMKERKIRFPLLALYIFYLALAGVFTVLQRVGFFEKHTELLEQALPVIIALVGISIALFFGFSMYSSYEKGFGRTLLNPIIHGLGSFSLGYVALSLTEWTVINPAAFALLFGLPTFLLWAVPSLLGTVIGSLARRA